MRTWRDGCTCQGAWHGFRRRHGRFGRAAAYRSVELCTVASQVVRHTCRSRSSAINNTDLPGRATCESCGVIWAGGTTCGLYHVCRHETTRTRAWVTLREAYLSPGSTSGACARRASRRSSRRSLQLEHRASSGRLSARPRACAVEAASPASFSLTAEPSRALGSSLSHPRNVTESERAIFHSVSRGVRRAFSGAHARSGLPPRLPGCLLASAL